MLIFASGREGLHSVSSNAAITLRLGRCRFLRHAANSSSLRTVKEQWLVMDGSVAVLSRSKNTSSEPGASAFLMV